MLSSSSGPAGWPDGRRVGETAFRLLSGPFQAADTRGTVAVWPPPLTSPSSARSRCARASGWFASGGAKQRSLLALLLLDTGRVVSSDRLIEELWGGDPPEDAATALQQHVSRLRKLLEPHEVLETRSPGYVLAIDPQQVDFSRFERLRDEGRALLEQGRAEDASRTLRSALELWRGEPLFDLAGEPFARDALPRLEEERLEAVEARTDADLAAGRDAELVGELRRLVGEHPYRERLRAQLMLALYRAGRQSEALEAYADARRTLVGELGLEPGPELQRLQQAMLAHDPAVDAPHNRPPPPSSNLAMHTLTATVQPPPVHDKVRQSPLVGYFARRRAVTSQVSASSSINPQ